MEMPARVLILASLLLVTVLFKTEPTEASPCPAKWIQYGQYCYKPYWELTKSWWGAMYFCQDIQPGGMLASLTSEDLVTYLRQEIMSKLFEPWRKTVVVWIGLHDLKTEEDFQWLDGQPYDFQDWEVGEPNNANNGEDCVNWEINNYYSHWNDNRCERQRGFLCQVPKTKMRSTTTTRPSSTLSASSPKTSTVHYRKTTTNIKANTTTNRVSTASPKLMSTLLGSTVTGKTITVSTSKIVTKKPALLDSTVKSTTKKHVSIKRSPKKIPLLSRTTKKPASTKRSTRKIPLPSRTTKKPPSTKRSTKKIPLPNRTTKKPPSTKRSTKKIPLPSRTTKKPASTKRSTNKTPLPKRTTKKPNTSKNKSDSASYLTPLIAIGALMVLIAIFVSLLVLRKRYGLCQWSIIVTRDDKISFSAFSDANDI